jgi:hypothetical protein
MGDEIRQARDAFDIGTAIGEVVRGMPGTREFPIQQADQLVSGHRQIGKVGVAMHSDGWSVNAREMAFQPTLGVEARPTRHPRRPANSARNLRS